MPTGERSTHVVLPVISLPYLRMTALKTKPARLELRASVRLAVGGGRGCRRRCLSDCPTQHWQPGSAHFCALTLP